ncbi:MAG: Rv1355c family protein [Flavobacteriales bacterium]|nr:Rv1355c family protein [Flavobacteriales bacterium]
MNLDVIRTTLGGRQAVEGPAYRPEFIRPVDDAGLHRLNALLEQGVVVHDTLHAQLMELVKSLRPEIVFTRDDLEAAALAHLNGTDPIRYGVWVHYPWSHRLVHLLDEAEFALVRTDRNRNKITRAEQELLSSKKVGVIGLSVGQSVSLTLALERSFGEIRLADHDTLELSNLNRIRSGVHEMGTPKVLNTAREIAELDPFLRVSIFPEGITKANMDRFFCEGGDLDLLIEECDSVDIKILARQKAKALRIPVVMDMSDRGCLDVERFDLEPARPLMHGWIDHLDLEAAGRPMTNEQKIPYMLPIVGTDTLSTRMKASMIEMGETVSTWPQLASAVALGGAMTADVHRRILLGQFTASGRWYIDLEALIADQKGNPKEHATTTPMGAVDPEGIVNAVIRELPPVKQPMSRELAEELAHAAALAPSAGNMQPWNFILAEGRFFLFHDKVRSRSHWDPDHLMAHIALGTCLENIRLAASAKGIALSIDTRSAALDDALIAVIEAGPVSTPMEEVLFPWITKRCTNRKVVDRVLFPSEHEAQLRNVVEFVPGCGLRIFTDPADLERFAELCSRSEKIRLLDPTGHREFFEHEVRWTEEEAKQSGDGLDLATMEMTEGQMAALRIAADPAAMRLVDEWRGGRGLQRFSRKGIANASAVAVVTTRGRALMDRLEGGRAGQRLWMEANRLGWAVHPISAPVFLTHAAPLLGDLAEHHRSELAMVEKELSRFFTGEDLPLFMLRLSPAGEPSARSLRLPLHRLLSVHGSITA